MKLTDRQTKKDTKKSNFAVNQKFRFQNNHLQSKIAKKIANINPRCFSTKENDHPAS